MASDHGECILPATASLTKHNYQMLPSMDRGMFCLRNLIPFSAAVLVISTSIVQASAIPNSYIRAYNFLSGYDNDTNPSNFFVEQSFPEDGRHDYQVSGASVGNEISLAAPYLNVSAKVTPTHKLVSATARAELSYYIEFVGAPGQISAHVTGKVGGSSTDYGRSDEGGSYSANVEFSSDAYRIGSSLYGIGDQSNSIRVRSGGFPPGISFASVFDGDYLFTTNTFYQISLEADASASVLTDKSFASASAYADPYFSLSPALSSEYRILLSSGVGNTPGSLSSVPLPSSAPLFGLALLGLASVGYAVNRRKPAEV